jgi:putative ABC transport system permease protein
MIPISYTVRNVLKHKITSVLTILGVGLVVFVYVGTQMLVDGLQTTHLSTGYDKNVIVIRKASQTEVSSIIMRDQGQIVSAMPEIARDADGSPRFTNENYVLIARAKRSGGDMANVVVRGVTDKSMTLRPNIKLIQGRMFSPGTSEIIAGKLAAARFTGCGLGETIRFGQREWTVVGIFDAQGSAHDSEIWGDILQTSDAFRRHIYSSLTIQLADPSQYQALKERIEGDPRLPLDVFREKEYYANQSRTISGFLTIAGKAISYVFSLGAIVGAMITMYAAVANRTREIGTLRSLGFSRLSILRTFLFEALVISLSGGVVGIIAASFLRFVQVSTINWDTFSELVFNFSISGGIIVEALVFALVMGLVGGFLPAVRASRLKIIDSLRAA